MKLALLLLILPTALAAGSKKERFADRLVTELKWERLCPQTEDDVDTLLHGDCTLTIQDKTFKGEETPYCEITCKRKENDYVWLGDDNKRANRIPTVDQVVEVCEVAFTGKGGFHHDKQVCVVDLLMGQNVKSDAEDYECKLRVFAKIEDEEEKDEVSGETFLNTWVDGLEFKWIDCTPLCPFE